MEKAQPLHIKYRPTSFSEMVGNESTVKSLQLLAGHPEGNPHSIVFHGPSGCGKTTLSRILAAELECSPTDFTEINAAEARGIDVIRAVEDSCYFRPLHGKVKIFLFDECHRLTTDATNALLKLVEETPDFIYFLFCTTEYNSLIKTLRTRLTPYPVNLLNVKDMKKLLTTVIDAEGVDFPDDVVNALITSAQGSPRQALVALGKVIDIASDAEILTVLEDYAVSETSLLEFCRELVRPGKKDITKWKDTLLDAAKDPESARLIIGGYLSAVLLNGGDPHIADMLSLFSSSMERDGKPALIYSCYLALLSA